MPPREVVSEHGHDLVQNRVRNVDADHASAGQAEKARPHTAKFQSGRSTQGL